MNQQAADAISKAKLQLVLKHPFFATIVCNMQWSEENSIPTMATDGKRVWYNADFVNALTTPQLLFVACHEVGHCIFGHAFRRGQRDVKKWNYAGDYVINDLLISEGIGDMPTGKFQGLHNPYLVKQGGGTTEGVYALLPEDYAKADGGGQEGGTALDACKGMGSPSEQATAEAETRVLVAKAAQVARMKGNLSAGLARMVDHTLTPVVNWQELLRRFATEAAKVDRTYARPKRRWLAEDLYLPSLAGQGMGEFVVAVDCSGSIDERQLSEFAAEIVAIAQDCQPSKLHVVYFDSKVCHHDTFERGETVTIAPHGGGGTAFSPVFTFLEEQNIQPCATVFLTDLYCSDFGPAPAHPVMWVTTAATTAPWGEVVEMVPKMKGSD